MSHARDTRKKMRRTLVNEVGQKERARQIFPKYDYLHEEKSAMHRQRRAK